MKPVSDNTYLIHPEITDRAVAERLVDMEMSQLLKRANIPPEYIYAFHKCGFFHPSIINNFRKLLGAGPLRSRLSKQEIKQWDNAVEEYHKKGGEIPGY